LNGLLAEFGQNGAAGGGQGVSAAGMGGLLRFLSAKNSSARVRTPGARMQVL